jgi:multiple sugar transport system substrate-binding protein
MEEITLSLFNHGPAAIDSLQSLLQKFEQRNNIRVHIELMPSWALGWSRLVEAALYHSGPDVSEVGNTWIGDLVRMEALRPFKHAEVEDITKEAHLFENVWMSGTRGEEGSASSVYSVPWVGDTRVVFYRRDLLKMAGVSEATAFKDAAHFEKTLATLQEKGIPMPLALPTKLSHLAIHNIASWIWGAGGDFLSPDGTSPTFDQPRALEGCKAYFRLGRYLSSEARNLEENESDRAFWSGRAAVILSGYWILFVNEMAPEVRDNLGAVPVPGVPFVGGHDLVIWNHSRHDSAALKLIQFLHTDEAGKELYPLCGLPISDNAWANPPFDSGLYPVFKEAMQKGRGFRGQLWGLVEKRLTDAYSNIWANVLKAPESSSDAIVEAQLKGLANRLRLTLGTNPA